MATTVKALTETRKKRLLKSGQGKNSMGSRELIPSGPEAPHPLIGSKTELWVSAIAGGALFGYGLMRFARALAQNTVSNVVNGSLILVGGTIAARGIRGLSAYDMSEPEGLENPASSVAHDVGSKAEVSMVIDAGAQELYDYWLDVENLPEFMDHVKSVTPLTETLSHWVVRGPGGVTLEWDSEIYTSKPGRLISWRSIEGSDVDQAGSVEFIPLGSSTEVLLKLRYDPPAGKLGDAVAKLIRQDPRTQMEDSLENLKEIIEHGRL